MELVKMFHRTALQVGAAILVASGTLAVAPNASACPAGGCLGSPPACPNNTNCITVTDPEFSDAGNSGYCTLDDAVVSFENGHLADKCQWTGGSSAFAILLPGTQNGHYGVQYAEPQGMNLDASYNQLPIAVIGSSAANSTILVGTSSFQEPIYIQAGSSLVNVTVTAWTGTFSQYFSPGNCVYIDGVASLKGVTIKNCFGDVTNQNGIQGVPALFVGPGANATVTNSTITTNSGGGIEVNTEGEDLITTLKIVGSVISYNASQSEGGGIAMYGGEINLIQDSLIENNTAGPGFSGGGISVDADAGNNGGIIDKIEQSGIVYNSADSGGGIALLNGSIGDGQVSGIDWCTIAYNQATDGVGGGVYVLNGPSITPNTLLARHDTVADNTAGFSGGGVWSESPQMGFGMDWEGSIFAYNTVFYGGADDFDGQLRIMGTLPMGGSTGIAGECWTDGLDTNQIMTLSNPAPTGWKASSCPPATTLEDQTGSPGFTVNSLSWSTGTWPSGTPALPYFPMNTAPAEGATDFYQKEVMNGSGLPTDELNHPPSHTGSGGYYDIGSIENLAEYSRTGWVASAQATSGMDVPAQAFDGNSSTRWSDGIPQSTMTSPAQYFQVDMGVAQSVSEVTLDSASSAGDYLRNYQVLVGTTNPPTTSVASGVGTGALTTIRFAPQMARYIRVVQTAASPGVSNWWSIAEINVWH